LDGDSGQPLALFESGAILIYLAEKTGRLVPRSLSGRHACFQWLMFQMSGIGPMFGQYSHFANYTAEKITYAIDRYLNETKRLYRVVDKRLSESEYLAGDEYSIADIATYPWVRGHRRRGVDIAEFPAVRRWLDVIRERDAVQRGLEVLTERQPKQALTDEQKANLFGDRQFTKR